MNKNVEKIKRHLDVLELFINILVKIDDKKLSEKLNSFISEYNNDFIKDISEYLDCNVSAKPFDATTIFDSIDLVKVNTLMKMVKDGCFDKKGVFVQKYDDLKKYVNGNEERR